MKKLILFCIIALFLTDNYAQNIFDQKSNVKLYGSIDLDYHKINDNLNIIDENTSLTIGLSIAAIFNKNFITGIYGFSNTENLYNYSLKSYLKYTVGGIWMGVRFFPKFPIHLNLLIRGGIGNMYYLYKGWSYYYYDEVKDNFFIVEPKAEIEFNIIEHFKISGGVSYRLTDKIIMLNTPTNILDTYSFNLSFKIVY